MSKFHKKYSIYFTIILFTVFVGTMFFAPTAIAYNEKQKSTSRNYNFFSYDWESLYDTGGSAVPAITGNVSVTHRMGNDVPSNEIAPSDQINFSYNPPDPFFVAIGGNYDSPYGSWCSGVNDTCFTEGAETPENAMVARGQSAGNKGFAYFSAVKPNIVLVSSNNNILSCNSTSPTTWSCNGNNIGTVTVTAYAGPTKVKQWVYVDSVASGNSNTGWANTLGMLSAAIKFNNAPDNPSLSIGIPYSKSAYMSQFAREINKLESEIADAGYALGSINQISGDPDVLYAMSAMQLAYLEGNFDSNAKNGDPSGLTVYVIFPRITDGIIAWLAGGHISPLSGYIDTYLNDIIQSFGYTNAFREQYSLIKSHSVYVSGKTDTKNTFYLSPEQIGSWTVTVTDTPDTCCEVPTPPPTVDLSVNNTTINTGSNVVLTWTSTNADSCVGSFDTEGAPTTNDQTTKWAQELPVEALPGSLNQRSIRGEVNTKYTITCTNASGSASDFVIVNTIPIVDVGISSQNYGGAIPEGFPAYLTFDSFYQWSECRFTSNNSNGDLWDNKVLINDKPSNYWELNNEDRQTGLLYAEHDYTITCDNTTYGGGGVNTAQDTINLPNQPTNSCGNGTVTEAFEQCDSGGSDTLQCNTSGSNINGNGPCTFTFCGDKVRQSRNGTRTSGTQRDEECDYEDFGTGTSQGSDWCSSSCGFVQDLEILNTDLVVERYNNPITDPIKVGDRVRIKTTVRNLAQNGFSGSFYSKYVISGSDNDVSNQNFSSINNNSLFTKSYTGWIPSVAGNYTLTVDVDNHSTNASYQNKIIEHNEGNNIASVTFQVVSSGVGSCGDDGSKNGTEECDGADFGLTGGSNQCVDYDSNQYSGGTLSCSSCFIDISQCTLNPDCSNGEDDDGDGYCDTEDGTCSDGTIPGDPGCGDDPEKDSESNCGNGTCEAYVGENPISCPQDCEIKGGGEN